MSKFDEVSERIVATFSDWIKIEDRASFWTIENFEKINYNEKVVKPHCVDCVIINQCYFKNEENKKPYEFDYSNFPQVPIDKQGLYHPCCHCQKRGINAPKPNDIVVFDLAKRMDYLFHEKIRWLNYMGYNIEDKNEVFYLIEKLSKESYCKGDYQNNPPPEEKKKYGFRIRVKILFPGKREKLGQIFPITSSYIVYPYGKLKNNTPIGGKAI